MPSILPSAQPSDSPLPIDSIILSPLHCPLTYPLHGHGFAPGCALPFDSLVHSPLRSPLPGLLLRPMIGTVRPAMRSLLRNPLRIRGKAMGCASISPYNNIWRLCTYLVVFHLRPMNPLHVPLLKHVIAY